MAKRGSTRPWRVPFKWETGVGYTQTHGTKDDALRACDELDATAERNGMRLEYVVKHRETGEVIRSRSMEDGA